MEMADEIRLTLRTNSQAFLAESVSKAVLAHGEPRQWQFAITTLVQSLELALKAKLEEIHPMFVFENIDDPKHTINITGAIKRLSNPKIGTIHFSETDNKRLHAAIKLRNELTHAESRLNVHHAQNSFCFVFSFVADFFRHHLSTSVNEFLRPADLDQIIQWNAARKELRKRALHRIAEKNIPDQDIRDCPECFETTFVLFDAECACYTCMHHHETVECPRCGTYTYFPEEMISLHDDFDTDLDEGRYVVLNRFGMDYDEVCPECIGDARNEISTARYDDYVEYMQQEAYYSPHR
ncbi:hypothetical protein ASG68_12065 [Rhizobium sp. Leaf453]|uniref:Mannose/fructose/N-acetylgalactosamine-specific phosphotransferase system component IIB n=2 Tax=Rhizobium TaxID=379 RepID=A0ABS4EH57_9HYPH|nr:hypothetical protein [Rhizobium herbae]KQT95455.1 hypothetical protein ASG68_12065 [Rhizobium sp. Leaf453]MBP1857275.1 mannose/fructose/N-acetylgalactosamine-specific phosphotransferase system component IIB [Rhizobium herbae]